MFNRIRQRLRDIGTIRMLCEAAEKHANAGGQREPGAEHFVMAALTLPDGTAQRAFQRVNASPGEFHAAVIDQYGDALRDIGMAFPADDSPVAPTVQVPQGKGPYKAQASGQRLVQMLADVRKADADKPLLGAHVVLAAASAQYGVTPRALQRMGLEPASLVAAAAAEIAGSRTA